MLSSGQMDMNSLILIDPDERAAQRLKAAIPWEEAGFDFLGAYPGLLACPLPDTQGSLLVIAEILLPGMSFREAFRALRNRFPGAALAVLTSDGRLAPAREAFRYGVIRYLQKPFSAEEVMELLNAFASHGGRPAPWDAPPSGKEGNIARRVQEYVDAHFSDHRLELKNVAEEFHLNYSYLSFLFKKQSGMKYSEYVGSIRIRLAKRLLRDTEMKMAEVARAAGFRDAQVLYYAFKNATGTTPRAYREGGLPDDI